VRTFALASLLGAAAGLSGGFYPAVSLAFTALIVAFLNARHLMMGTKLATTTSMALILVAFCGVLCGEGHVFTPVATGLITAGCWLGKNQSRVLSAVFLIRKSAQRFYWEF
jgi:uncharacterized membrane protein (DUF4010 family)